MTALPPLLGETAGRHRSPPASGRPDGWLVRWSRELRFAARSLWRAPGFTLAVFCTLVACIGPNAAILSALYALVLKPLPFPHPRRLVTITNIAEKRGGQAVWSSVPQYRDFKAHADLFAGFALIKPENITLDEKSSPMRLEDDLVTSDFFSVLGVRPVLGRFFTPDEEETGRNLVLVVSHAFWVAHYNADPEIVGKVIHAYGGVAYTIIGVAPASLESLWKPTCFYEPYAPAPFKVNPQSRYINDAILYGRLKPGVNPGSGLAQLETLEARFRAGVAGPRTRAFIAANGFRLSLAPLRVEGALGEARSLWLLQGGALLVLLIGCVNVVNLCLARTNARRSDLAIRVALGAGRSALVRPMLAESLWLTGAATVAGLGLALAVLHIFNAYLPIIVRSAPPVTLDPVVVGILLAVMLAVTLLLGLLPLRLVGRTGLRVGDWRSASAGGGARAVGSVLVTAQVGVAVVLLIGASLLIRSFENVLDVKLGFDAAHVVQGRIALNPRYANPTAYTEVHERILESLREIPGVQGAAEVFDNALSDRFREYPFTLRDRPNTAGASQPTIALFPVSPGFFATMGMKLLAGRRFNAADNVAKDPVLVVDETFVRRYFPGQIVVGQEMSLGQGTPPPGAKWPRIVGVVTSARLGGPQQRNPEPFVYVPINGWRQGGFDVLVRSSLPASTALREIRARLHAIDPSLPLYAASSLQQRLDEMLMSRRGITLLLGAFSGLALLLAAIGLYGILAYDVSQRTREIGIRGAIGASRGQIIALILRQGLWKAGVGLAAGLLGAALLSRYLASLLFGITAADPASYALVVLVLGGVSFLACWLPARRAAKVDPIIALRVE